MVATISRVVKEARRHRVKSIYIYLLSLLVFALFGPVSAYIILAVYSSIKLPEEKINFSVNPWILFLSVIPHLVISGGELLIELSDVTFYVFGILTAILEEIYFRSIMAREHGSPISILAYTIFHIPLHRPNHILESALLLPIYMLLGIILQEIYWNEGLLSCIVFHSIYNIVALSYKVFFNLYNLLLLYSGLLVTLLMYLWVVKCFSFPINLLKSLLLRFWE